MSKPPERVFRKADDYAVVYADSVIYQCGSNTARLIFYQKEVEPSESGERLETRPQKITLKFEVRVPIHELAGLASNIQADNEGREQVRDETRKSGADQEVLNSWYALDDRYSDLLLDTLGNEVGDITKADLQADLDRLRAHRNNRSA